ncbi:MAG: N-acetylglucosamine-6-phosphate deacetylase [Eubacteriales bacterium]|nr:N-acetylglucosamine-6-phosphate deacetylase [Eubacteriales bacterium]
MRYLVQNAKALLPDGIKDVCVLTDGEKIEAIAGHIDAPADAYLIDAQGKYLSPGFVDIHVHGGGGAGSMDGSPEDILTMADAHARHGTTTVLPTTWAAPIAEQIAAMDCVKRAQEMECGAEIAGIHLEGPFLAPAQAGAQQPENLLIPAKADWRGLLEHWDGVRMMGVAPELEGAMELGEALAQRGIVASAAHTDATIDTMREAARHGFSDITHLYSGCSGMIRVNGYRVPGVIEAGLLLDEYTVQVIADGSHLPHDLLRLIYKCKGPEKIELITDGLEFAATELAEGTEYTQKNGMRVVYEAGVMKLPSRQAFAGSVATLNRCVRTMRQAGVPLCEAVRMATANPARRIGLGGRKGLLKEGFDADLVLFDEDIDVSFVMSRGKIIRNDR